MTFSRHLVICLGFGLSVACGLDPNAPREPELTTTLTTTPESPNQTGGDGDPVGACQELEDTLAACVPTLAGTLSCSSWDGWACDLTDYFQCITDAYGSCSGGTFPDLDPLSLQDCAALSTC